MSGINPNIIFAITRIRSTVADDIGNIRTGFGTGFFLRGPNKSIVFVTNRHNVDPTLQFGSNWSLKSASLLLRNYIGNAPLSETKFFELDINQSPFTHSSDADVSVLVRPLFVESLGTFGFNPAATDIADQSFFAQRVQMMNFVSFIGFPGTSSAPWWDQQWNTPLARMASISSDPSIPFTNEEIKTNDVIVVSGLSFSGSSGSPVFLHEKGVRPGGDFYDPGYTPPTLLGIMSGHWWEKSFEPEMFRHSGLSYFTRSTAILSLISSAIASAK